MTYTAEITQTPAGLYVGTLIHHTTGERHPTRSYVFAVDCQISLREAYAKFTGCNAKTARKLKITSVPYAAFDIAPAAAAVAETVAAPSADAANLPASLQANLQAPPPSAVETAESTVEKTDEKTDEKPTALAPAARPKTARRPPFTPYGLNGYLVDKQGNIRLMLDRKARAKTIVLHADMFAALADMVKRTQEQQS